MSTNNTTAIVAHDAGAANLILSWLQTGVLSIDQSICHFTGPAKILAATLFPSLAESPLEEVINRADSLISGTGWSSDIEHQARCLAAAKKIHSIAVIDHWVNYPQRFIRDSVQQLPNEIWVVDDYASVIASRLFPDTQIIVKPNTFLIQQVDSIHHFAASEKRQQHRILYLMEPIRVSWDNSVTPAEFIAFEFFIKNLRFFDNEKECQIIIKPHPSDTPGKYDHLLEKYPLLSIDIVSDKTLAELIATADTVVGCETYAMVVALTAGKKVVSVLPPIAPPCALPHKEIIRLAEQVAA